MNLWRKVMIVIAGIVALFIIVFVIYGIADKYSAGNLYVTFSTHEGSAAPETSKYISPVPPIGMSSADVLEYYGQPYDKDVTITEYGRNEFWCYNDDGFKFYVSIEDGFVTSVSY